MDGLRKRSDPSGRGPNGKSSLSDLLIDNVATLAICVVEPTGTIVSWNAGAQQILGHAAEDILGQSFARLFTPADRKTHRPRGILACALRDGQCEAQSWIARKDGTTVWASVAVQALRDPAGKFAGFAAVLRDFSGQRQAELDLRASEARYRFLAENTSDIVIQADLDSTRRYVSPACRALLGYEPEELVGTTAIDILHPEDKEPFRWFLDALPDLDRDRAVSRQRYRHRDGHYIWGETTYGLVKDPASGRPTGYVASIRDISERHAAEEKARYLAQHDPLTGLPNRSCFQERMEAATGRLRAGDGTAALLWLDLNRFKFINDTFGHAVGDGLLRQIGERLRNAVAAEDVVARIGGDEFAVLRHDGGSRSAIALFARRLISVISESVEIEGLSLSVGAKIGISVMPDDGLDVDRLFRNADLALYRARDVAQSKYCFYEAAMDDAMRKRLQIELDMRDAIACESFRLEYQPIVDAESGQVVGCEALVRWRHATDGDVPPARFIPIAEESGLIVPLGAWVLSRACQDAAAWPNGDIQIAVNVSACQMRRPGLEATIVTALKASGLQPWRLVVEITESVLIEDNEPVLALLHRLRAIGVKIALDDFGTGYSSLSYLHRFPFDKLKIDRGFIQAMGEPGAFSIVQLVAELGERLGITIVAEGVETKEQLERIRQVGCRHYQGYLFSRSVPTSNVPRLLSPERVTTAA